MGRGIIGRNLEALRRLTGKRASGFAPALLVLAGVGTYLLLRAHAVTPTASVQPELGALSSNAGIKTDTTASGGKAVVFGSLATANLDEPHKKEMAMELVSSAENSSLDWRAQYGYIEDIGDGRGYTGGIIGFCSGCGDMADVVGAYDNLKPSNILAKYYDTLVSLGNAGSASHTGLDPTFTTDWKTAASDPLFQQAQNQIRDSEYFNPALSQAKADGLRALGQFIYYDAMVMHGPGNDTVNCSNLVIGDFSFGGIRAATLCKAKPPSQGGNETTYLNAYLSVRKQVMLTEAAHSDTSRIDTEQQLFLNAGNMYLNPPLSWSTYGDPYTIASYPNP